MNKKKWSKGYMSLKDLSLCDDNPRFPDEYFRKPEKDLIEYYLEDEKRFELRKFSREIVSEFDLPQVEKIIILKKRNKNIVLEGNRRVAIYKLLVNPSLAKRQRDIDLFKKLREQIKINNNFKLEVNITKEREEGFRILDRKHKKRNNEVPWGELERRNDSVRRLKGTLQDIRRVELGKFVKTLDLPKEIISKVLGKGYVTTLYRIIDSEPARIKMKYKVLDDGQILVENEKNFLDLLKVVVYNVYTKKRFDSKKIDVDSRHLNNKTEIANYLNSISEKDSEKVKEILDEKNKKKGDRKRKDRKRKISPKCFVLMPLSGLDSVYKTVQSAWKKVFGARAKIFHQTDDRNKGGKELIDNKILKNIQNATAVIGILSMGKKERVLYEFVPKNKKKLIFSKTFPFNANVALEIGYAIRCADDPKAPLKDYFLIADNSRNVSSYKFATKHFFDLGHRDITPYTEDELDKLGKTLVNYFKEFKKENKL